MYYKDPKRQSGKRLFLAYVSHSEAFDRSLVNYVVIFFLLNRAQTDSLTPIVLLEKNLENVDRRPSDIRLTQSEDVDAAAAQ